MTQQQHEERPLSGGDEEQASDPQVPQDLGIFASAASQHTHEEAAVPPLSVAAFLGATKAVIKTVYLCTDGTIDDQIAQLVRELDDLLDVDGNPVATDGDEPSLADTSRVAELSQQINAKNAERSASLVKVVFQRMPGDEYEVLHAKHRMSNGQVPLDKLPRFASELITACAIEPKLSKEEVVALRHATSKAQFRVLEDAAYEVNNKGGSVAPKLPSYLVDQGQQEF